jgi:hypothetical protein
MDQKIRPLCHCGRPLHYRDVKVHLAVKKLIDSLGEFVNVTVGKSTWKVQRHYIALHGIKGSDLAKLGFERVS